MVCKTGRTGREGVLLASHGSSTLGWCRPVWDHIVSEPHSIGRIEIPREGDYSPGRCGLPLRCRPETQAVRQGSVWRAGGPAPCAPRNASVPSGRGAPVTLHLTVRLAQVVALAALSLETQTAFSLKFAAILRRSRRSAGLPRARRRSQHATVASGFQGRFAGSSAATAPSPDAF